MVQSIGSPADSFSLFHLDGGAYALSGKSAEGAAFSTTTQSGESSDAASGGAASLLDTGSTQTGSGGYASVFQRLSSGLQALMVQMQSITGDGGTSLKNTTVSSGSVSAADSGGGSDPPALSAPPGNASTVDPPVAQPASLSVAATAVTPSGPTVTASGTTADDSAVLFHASKGNRALQGDIDAMINDLHGFIQVANGNVLVEGEVVSTPAAASAVTANDNATPTASGPSADETFPGGGNAGLSQSAASGDVAGSTFGLTSYGYAQTVTQAVQNYNVASAVTSNPQPAVAVNAVG